MLWSGGIDVYLTTTAAARYLTTAAHFEVVALVFSGASVVVPIIGYLFFFRADSVDCGWLQITTQPQDRSAGSVLRLSATQPQDITAGSDPGGC
jgi:hypothetical protein